MMKEYLTVAIAIISLALCALPAPVVAQVTTVTSDEGKVIIDGDFVRIEGQGQAVEITGNWRAGTNVRVADALLIELGAVRVDDHIRVSLAGDILFEFGSAVVEEASTEVLKNVAVVIRSHAHGEVLVVGHSDAVGHSTANQRLSEARAIGVIRWLQRNEGIPLQMMVGRGMGEDQPVADNATPDGRDNPAGRARNRRVELFIGTTEHADVRAAAGLVTVRSAGTEVRITEDSVDVGDLVRINEGRVRVGGMNISATEGSPVGGTVLSVSDDRAFTCSAGRNCNVECPEGDCRLICSAGATCNYACRGGDCEMSCSAGAICDFSCTGGDCHFSRATGSTSTTSCAGGDCTGG